MAGRPPEHADMRGRPCIFGEVLFDHFPDGRRVLGGAPFNVAWHLQAFGESPLLVSRIGDDADGAAVADAMDNWDMERAGLQTDPRLPTGRVQVSIEDGEPSYEIVHPSAWDAIEPPGLDARCLLLYHGTLALRDDRARRAWRQLRRGQPETVFVDVNLRPPWWRRGAVLEAIAGADWVKLNRHELDELAPGGESANRRARSFLGRHGLSGLVMTDGARGAGILTAGGEHWEVRPDAHTPVADTVGAGDALAAVVILGLLRRWPLGDTLERAQSFASAIVGRRGATVREPDFYAALMGSWFRESGQLPR
jgi:fructokinase